MTLVVAPERYVPHLLQTRKPSHVLTLVSPGALAPICPDVPQGQHLILRFNDIVSPADNLIPPGGEQVQAILDFGARWDRSAPMLIHCFAGISRSTAAAYILACEFEGAGSEIDLAAKLRHLSPTATPNACMVALADDLMGRGGAMVVAVRDIGRGEDAFEGTIFDLPLSGVTSPNPRSRSAT